MHDMGDAAAAMGDVQGIDFAGLHFDPGAASPRHAGGGSGSKRPGGGGSAKRAGGGVSSTAIAAAGGGGGPGAPPKSPLSKALRGPPLLPEYGGLVPLPVPAPGGRQDYRSQSLGSAGLSAPGTHVGLPGAQGTLLSSRPVAPSVLGGGFGAPFSVHPPWPAATAAAPPLGAGVPPPLPPPRLDRSQSFGSAGIPSNTHWPPHLKAGLGGGVAAAAAPAAATPADPAGAPTPGAMAAFEAAFGPPSPTFRFTAQAVAATETAGAAGAADGASGRRLSASGAGGGLTRQSSAHARLHSLGDAGGVPVDRMRRSRDSPLPRTASNDSLAVLAMMQSARLQAGALHEPPPLLPRTLSPLALAAAETVAAAPLHHGQQQQQPQRLSQHAGGVPSGGSRTSIEVLGLDRLPLSLGGTRRQPASMRAGRLSGVGGGGSSGGLCSSDLPFFLDEPGHTTPDAGLGVGGVASSALSGIGSRGTAAADLGYPGPGGEAALGLPPHESRVTPPGGLLLLDPGALHRVAPGGFFSAPVPLLAPHHQQQQQQQRALFNAGARSGGALDAAAAEPAPPTGSVSLLPHDDEVAEAMAMFLRPLSPPRNGGGSGHFGAGPGAPLPGGAAQQPPQQRPDFDLAAPFFFFDAGQPAGGGHDAMAAPPPAAAGAPFTQGPFAVPNPGGSVPREVLVPARQAPPLDSAAGPGSLTAAPAPSAGGQAFWGVADDSMDGVPQLPPLHLHGLSGGSGSGTAAPHDAQSAADASLTPFSLGYVGAPAADPMLHVPAATPDPVSDFMAMMDGDCGINRDRAVCGSPRASTVSFSGTSFVGGDTCPVPSAPPSTAGTGMAVGEGSCASDSSTSVGSLASAAAAPLEGPL